MLRVLADENIANLDDYLLCHQVELIKMAGRAIDRQSLITHQPDALFIRSVTQVTQENLGNLSNTPLKFIGSATIGIDHIDTQYLADHHINFTNASGCSKHSVAQYVITAILHTHQSPKTNLRLGIIGLGNIGNTLARYAKRLGWQVFGFDPFLATGPINNASLDEILDCDVISIHTPLTKTGSHPTYQMLNAQTLAKIRPKALLINSARGEIIDESALLAAINQKRLSVVLDVFPNEPFISQQLLDALKLATPHIAGYTLEGKIRGTDMIYQAFCQTFNLPILQHFSALLPPNPYHFSILLNHQNQQPLAWFYDIQADFETLKAAACPHILGSQFDMLRKNYHLRREWIFD